MAQIERTKNATRNIVFGVFLKIYQMLVPFLMRTAMIYFMGVKYLGLNSLFASVLQVLNLAELGVGSAMVYSMYKPIAEDDEDTVCALMNLYKIYYRVIGLVIAVLGGILIPFIPKLISGELPADVNIYVLYMLNLGATVLSYWMFAYKNSILQAHQRGDVGSKVTLITTSIQYFLQLFILWKFKNYYLYVLVILATQAFTNVIMAITADRLYPQFKPRGKIESEERKKINRRIKDLFTSKIGSIIYDSADTIVISAFLGLSMLAVYQNYFFILSSVTGVIGIIFASCTAGIGNSIVVESKEKNFNDLNKITLIICWGSGVCSACLLCLYQPFMELWVGKKLMLSDPTVICFVIYFFIRQLNSLLNMYKDASGMWHEDRFRPLIAALVNLLLNLILVQYIGIYGILLSTVLAILCVGMPWLLHNLFTVVFERIDLIKYGRKLVYYSVVVIFSCFVTGMICSKINYGLVVTLLIRGVICVILPNLIFYISFRKKKEFRETLELINYITKGRIKSVLRILGLNN